MPADYSMCACERRAEGGASVAPSVGAVHVRRAAKMAPRAARRSIFFPGVARRRGKHSVAPLRPAILRNLAADAGGLTAGERSNEAVTAK